MPGYTPPERIAMLPSKTSRQYRRIEASGIDFPAISAHYCVCLADTIWVSKLYSTFEVRTLGVLAVFLEEASSIERQLHSELNLPGVQQICIRQAQRRKRIARDVRVLGRAIGPL